MAKTEFYFYDLETTGLDPKVDRIVQFAGIRTDENFEQIGDEFECYVRLSEEVIPSPWAVTTNGTTPQKTVEEGYTEAEFLRVVMPEICRPNTVILGFNTIGFDDQFMRYTLYRNFYDPYAWQYEDGRSRWDLMDVVRMVRALRPDGINWPTRDDGTESNRLEHLTTANSIPHEDAHDALGDVRVTIAVAKLLKTHQPKMFDYLFTHRTKDEVSKLVNLRKPQPLVYTSLAGTTVILPLSADTSSDSAGVLAYNLKVDPNTLVDLDDTTFEEQVFHLSRTPPRPSATVRFKLNACPALAPVGVLDAEAEKRIGLSIPQIEERLASLRDSKGLIERIVSFHREKPTYTTSDVDGQLYDHLIDNSQQPLMRKVREADAQGISKLDLSFTDARLKELLPRYKARNYPKSLDEQERSQWERYRAERIAASLPRFSKDLAAAISKAGHDEEKIFLLQELQLWVESIMPVAD
ncbi:MAG TPA: exodeoxyribonuclease I [Candidatus Saccharimonadales bacterium]|nr:exodeoxyribonuclease I [Candidatus Saccharimonadales bacterium]